MIKWLLLSLAVIAAMLFWRMSAYAKRSLPRVGDLAPDFELPNQHGELVASSTFRGRWLVLYFYFRDDTPG